MALFSTTDFGRVVWFHFDFKSEKTTNNLLGWLTADGMPVSSGRGYRWDPEFWFRSQNSIGLFLINPLNIVSNRRKSKKWPRISECRQYSGWSLQGTEAKESCLQWGCTDQEPVVSTCHSLCSVHWGHSPSELNSFCYNGFINNEDFNFFNVFVLLPVWGLW